MDQVEIKLVAFDTSTMNDLGKFLKTKAGKEGVSAAVRHLTAKTPFCFPDDWPEEYRTEEHMQLLVLKGESRLKYERNLQKRVS